MEREISFDEWCKNMGVTNEERQKLIYHLASIRHERLINKLSYVPIPEGMTPVKNGATEPCDMLVGPCCCGATHKASDWKISL